MAMNLDITTFAIIENNIGIIKLNSPSSLNSMNDEMGRSFDRLISSIISNPEPVRALIITGQGRAFSSGGDLSLLKHLSTLEFVEARDYMIKFYNYFLGMLTKLDIPTIAAINGIAVGAGFSLACACDLRVVANNTILGSTFTEIGVHPGMGISYTLPHIIGTTKAAEYLLTSSKIKSQEWAKLGLFNNLVDSGEVLTSALEIANTIVKCGKITTTGLIRTLRIPMMKDLEAALYREATCQAECFSSQEFKNRLANLISKVSTKKLEV
jgi:enoyl-CoA hydratase/carnithine racemase